MHFFISFNVFSRYDKLSQIVYTCPTQMAIREKQPT